MGNNGHTITKLLINENMHEIKEFRNHQFSMNAGYLHIDNYIQDNQLQTQITSSSQYTSQEKFMYNVQAKTLRQIKTVGHEMICVAVATLSKVVPDKFGWFYLGCTNCTFKALEGITNYHCKCGVQAGDTDIRIYPSELRDIMGTTLVFCVKLQPSSKQCSVNKSWNDTALIATIKEQFQIEENTSKGEPSRELLSQEILFDTQSLSTTDESDIENIQAATSAKRPPTDYQQDNGDNDAIARISNV
uniref:Uncharacterized protein LOC101500275 n=1 Tax=Cicer arietinum TaxID=3827 RepID=A0A1S2YTG1_CICAR|nr:uncharacterized protein LOC101500275 [Cicer arietinum]